MKWCTKEEPIAGFADWLLALKILVGLGVRSCLLAHTVGNVFVFLKKIFIQ